jgi:fatty acid desaturase
MISRSQASTYLPARSANPSIPEVLNFGLAGLHISSNLFQFFILPLYLLPKNLWWSLLLIPIACLTNPFWALVHEAIHDSFNSSSHVNLIFGRWLAIFFGSPFHVLRLTHLSHHKFNRSPTEKGTEIYDPGEVSKIKASFKYFFYIFCGLYLLEVCSSFLFFLPPNIFRKMRRRLIDRGNVQEKWLAQKLMDNKIVRDIRVDGVAIFLILAISAFCFGKHWILFAGLLGVRTFLISFMDNVYHYRTPLHLTVSGHNLFLPRVFSGILLNFNLHRVHHANPSVSWVELPAFFVQQCETYDRGFFTAALDQLRGPIALSELAVARTMSKKSTTPRANR